MDKTLIRYLTDLVEIKIVIRDRSYDAGCFGLIYERDKACLINLFLE